MWACGEVKHSFWQIHAQLLTAQHLHCKWTSNHLTALFFYCNRHAKNNKHYFIPTHSPQKFHPLVDGTGSISNTDFPTGSSTYRNKTSLLLHTSLIICIFQIRTKNYSSANLPCQWGKLTAHNVSNEEPHLIDRDLASKSKKL